MVETTSEKRPPSIGKLVRKNLSLSLSRSTQTRQQGLMEYYLNLLNFLSMLFINILLVTETITSYFSDGAKNALVRPIYRQGKLPSSERLKCIFKSMRGS